MSKKHSAHNKRRWREIPKSERSTQMRKLRQDAWDRASRSTRQKFSDAQSIRAKKFWGSMSVEQKKDFILKRSRARATRQKEKKAV